MTIAIKIINSNRLMSHGRNLNWLNDRRIIYRRDPINDIPTIETRQYCYYENGTYECYNLFASKAKITTYKSLKWHMLVLFYLNQDHDYSSSPFFEHVARFIAKKENGFVTFFIGEKALNEMIIDVYHNGGDPPKNKLRKVVFKPYSGLDLSGKLKIVGQLIGRSSIDKDMIYETMLDLNDMGKKITICRIACVLNCATRTIHRHMCDTLKQEKQILNEEL